MEQGTRDARDWAEGNLLLGSLTSDVGVLARDCAFDPTTTPLTARCGQGNGHGNHLLHPQAGGVKIFSAVGLERSAAEFRITGSDVGLGELLPLPVLWLCVVVQENSPGEMFGFLFAEGGLRFGGEDGVGRAFGEAVAHAHAEQDGVGHQHGLAHEDRSGADALHDGAVDGLPGLVLDVVCGFVECVAEVVEKLDGRVLRHSGLLDDGCVFDGIGGHGKFP